MKKTSMIALSIVAILALGVVVGYSFFYKIPVTVAPSQAQTASMGDDTKESKVIDLPLNRDNKYDDITTENSDIVRLTRSDGSGWNLKKGETISISYSLDLKKVEGANVENGEWMGVGYIKDNELCLGYTEQQKLFEYEITADSDGEYYPYFQNLCAGYIVPTNIVVQ